MMKGQLVIDGKDLYSDFGLVLLEGGYDELVAFPPLKAVKTNDWQEEDGIEADLEAPVLNTRNISMKFAELEGAADMGGFLELLSDKAYHRFYGGSLKREFRLRLVSNPKLEWKNTLGFVTFKFADDSPLEGYTYEQPFSTISEYRDYSIDDKFLTDYGVRVLQGTLASIDKQPDVKPNLLRNIATQSGAEYDNDGKVTFKSKDVQVKCLMRADTIGEFWRNHDALLYDLIRPDERRLFVDARGREFPCYYKSCKTDRFFSEGKIWWEFTLTLVFTSYRLIGRRPALRLVSDGTLRLISNGNMRLTI